MGAYDGKSIVNRVGLAIGLSAVILLTWFGFKGCSAMLENGKYASRAAIVRKAIKNNDYTLASRLIVDLESKHLLKEEDITRLPLELEKKKKSYAVSAALAQNDYNKARVALDDLKSSGDFIPKELSALEKQVIGISEQAIFDKLNTEIKGESRTELAKHYLKIHPGGIHKKDAVEYLLSDSCSLLLAHLKSHESESPEFTGIYNKVAYLNSILEKYAAEKISLSKLVPLEELLKQADAYAKNVTFSPAEGRIEIGSTVQTIKSDSMYSEDYIKERALAVPVGSIGTVVNRILYLVPPGEVSTVYVQFDSVSAQYLTETFEAQHLSSYWEKTGKKNVLQYEARELKKGDLIPAVRKSQLIKEVEKLKQNLKGHALTDEGIAAPYNSEGTKTILETDFNILSTQFSDRADFAQVLLQLRQLNKNLKKYYDHSPILSKVVPLDEIIHQANTYLPASYVVCDVQLRIGSSVKYVSCQTSEWVGNYVTQRDKNFPMGSVGTIIAIGKYGWAVKFDDSHSCQWPETWDGINQYWTDKEKNIGVYKEREIQPVRRLTQIEKNQFTEEVTVLKQRFSKYK